MMRLKPTLVAEIRFAEWTDENQLCQASYKRGSGTDKSQWKQVVHNMKTKQNTPMDEKICQYYD